MTTARPVTKQYDSRAARLRRFALALARYDALPRAPWTAEKHALNTEIVALIESEGRINHKGWMFVPWLDGFRRMEIRPPGR